ncbi:hypothetical protein [Falsarthrobacter nasiphocae]|uniref:Mannosyltransferase (PIG-V) n=1 Tax=Falsarthrobacter nasiphocae TaxID=189863 RepID=A0AAE3YE23_9MICC|nr:hypothetical protein [Falsarthrobacter nasiphocae]MDR6891480.1 hypothetical protein [Falsarthrobacter nasiphocae]
MRALARAPWPLAVAALYLFSRVISTVILLAVAQTQPASPWGEARPSYLSYISIWDAEWYQRIFAVGYPDAVPRASDGSARANTWAFLPVFPLLVRAVAPLFGGGWMPAASVVAVLAGLAASLAMFALFERMMRKEAALWATLLVLCCPVGLLFQAPYAEGLHVALLALVLLCLGTRRFFAAAPLILVAALTRPTGAPMALALAVLALAWMRPAARARLSSSDFAGLMTALVAAFAGALAWPVIAWLGTGEPSAYTDTETVWRGGPLELFQPWAERARGLAGEGWWAVCLILALGAAALLAAPAVRRMGVTVWAWSASYILYLAAVFDPQTSTIRLLLPLFPLVGAAAVGWRSARISPLEGEAAQAARPRAGRSAGTSAGLAGAPWGLWAWLAVGVALQAVWVAVLWRWTELPGGGDYPP